MKHYKLSPLVLAGLLAGSLLSHTEWAMADISSAQKRQQEAGVLQDYRRLLPLQGGSNFRDMGGYRTEDDRRVKRGLLFRSGVMTALTEADQAYLEQLGVETVVDLRSREELELLPNHWVKNASLNYIDHDYSIMDLLGDRDPTQIMSEGHGHLYAHMPYMLKPQLQAYFDTVASGRAPVVVNCSAGQDRTGITSALMLTILGVPREVIIEDYLLSSDFRRPLVEKSGIDPEIAKNNAFARMMESYGADQREYAEPLMDAEGRAYLEIAFDELERNHGSVMGFIQEELGVSDDAIQRMRQLYLQ